MKKKKKPLQVVIENPELLPLARDRLTLALIELYEENSKKKREQELSESV